LKSHLAKLIKSVGTQLQMDLGVMIQNKHFEKKKISETIFFSNKIKVQLAIVVLSEMSLKTKT
jgi:hypothetical protein